MLWIAGALVVVLCSLLLSPAEAGYGTHQKLFLPPCYFHLLTHLKCPLCGLTTSLCHIARGELAAALRANVLGPIVCLFVLAQIPFRAARLLGRPFPVPRWWYQTWPLWTVLAFGLLCWPINIYLQLRGA
ncbi:MAG: DUF2752 domain-containing protein [Armatimonadota bacterium]|jgi:hypothetical protein